MEYCALVQQPSFKLHMYIDRPAAAMAHVSRRWSSGSMGHSPTPHRKSGEQQA